MGPNDFQERLYHLQRDKALVNICLDDGTTIQEVVIHEVGDDYIEVICTHAAIGLLQTVAISSIWVLPEDDEDDGDD